MNSPYLINILPHLYGADRERIRRGTGEVLSKKCLLPYLQIKNEPEKNVTRA
jgi:hypothetical protein